jgi:hypothetical protein
MRRPLIPTIYSHDMQICKARTASSNVPNQYLRIQSEGSVATLSDCLIEKTETHILIGLFLLCNRG